MCCNTSPHHPADVGESGGHGDDTDDGDRDDRAIVHRDVGVGVVIFVAAVEPVLRIRPPRRPPSSSRTRLPRRRRRRSRAGRPTPRTSPPPSPGGCLLCRLAIVGARRESSRPVSQVSRLRVGQAERRRWRRRVAPRRYRPGRAEIERVAGQERPARHERRRHVAFRVPISIPR